MTISCDAIRALIPAAARQSEAEALTYVRSRLRALQAAAAATAPGGGGGGGDAAAAERRDAEIAQLSAILRAERNDGASL